LLLVQAAQAWFTHAWPTQSSSLQQVPERHSPPQHFLPAPHCASAVQVSHWLARHSSPGWQSAALQHSPALHVPAQQTWLAPHWESAVQPWQVPSRQIFPAAQSEVWQQSPTWQLCPQQAWPAAQLPATHGVQP
jgi:hypothetical protein